MQLFDVAYLQQSLAGILVDEAEITRPGKETFDPDTGETTQGESTLIYQGACALIPETPASPGPYQTVPNSTDSQYRLILPVKTEGIIQGLDVRIVRSFLASQRDPEITRRRFKTKAPAPVTSFPVFKIIPLEETEGGA